MTNKVLIGCVLLLAGSRVRGQSFSVATVGDSFADSLWYAMRARPDLIQRSGVRLVRWSRPMVGLTRTDFFDYATWLRDSAEPDHADLCFVQIGSNDMQSIPVAKKRWIAYGSPQWKLAYAERTLEMAKTLAERRCGQVFWVLQPGFEKRDAMACHRELINEVQSGALHLDRTRVLEIVTSGAAYGPDKTHFSRDYLLALGPALFRVIDMACQIAHGGCLTCHRNVAAASSAAQIFPLRWWRGTRAVAVWTLDHVGIECKTAIVKHSPHARVRRDTRCVRADTSRGRDRVATAINGASAAGTPSAVSRADASHEPELLRIRSGCLRGVLAGVALASCGAGGDPRCELCVLREVEPCLPGIDSACVIGRLHGGP